jgi:hypothetical protein
MYVERSTGELGAERAPSVPGPTAQDSYRAMFKDQIGPALRRLGLRGSGMRYHLPVLEHFCTVSFIASKSSTWAVAHVVGQVSVIPHRVWQTKVAEGRAGGSKPSNDYYDPDRSRRFRSQWTVFAGLPTNQVASEVIEAVGDRAIPWMRALLVSGDPADTGLLLPPL